MIPALVAYVYAAAVAIGLGWMAVDVATAETPERMQLAQAQPMEAQTITENQIERFAQAHRQIVMLQQQYPTPEQEDILRERAAAAIAAQGLTVDEYNQIYLAAQRDEALRQQVVEEVRNLE